MRFAPRKRMKRKVRDQDVKLTITDRYKHLGGTFFENGGYMPEAKMRVSSALGSFGLMAIKIFANTNLAVATRVNMAFGFVMSKLLYLVHVWSAFSGPSRDYLNSMHMRAFSKNCR